MTEKESDPVEPPARHPRQAHTQRKQPAPTPAPKPLPGSSRTAVFFIQIAYLLALGIFVICYRVHWIEPRTEFFGPVPFLVPWFGAVGAVLLSLTGVFDNRKTWDPDYCYWHWARPLVGVIVATVSVLVFQSGILAVGGQLPSHATSSTAKNLLYYVIAFVVGYREDIFRKLIKRLADVILTPPEEPGASDEEAQAQQ